MHEPEPGTVGPLRVLIVDGDDRVRESLMGLLGIGRSVVVVGCAGETGEAISLAEATTPDVVVIDPRLPEIEGGIACIARLRASAPQIPILVMTCPDGNEQAALGGRVDGFIRKTFRPTELVAAIVAVGRPPA
jgi:DNA-binding NarL/FixJ family response regulator